MTRLQPSRSGLLLPASPEDLQAVCPAAEITRFRDTGRPAILCRIEGTPFAVADSPAAALGWCCGDHTDCPIWMADKDKDPALDRMRAARTQAATDALTRRQIAAGVRVDDRDAFADFAVRAVQEHVNADPIRFKAIAAERGGIVELDP